jgi:hypothetical protein
MASEEIGIVRRAESEHDYQRFGITPGVIKVREDGLRLPPDPGTFEWWYFDVLVPGTAAIIVIVLTKRPEGHAGPLDPMVSIKVHFFDELKERGDEFHPGAGNFMASQQRCEVRAGKTFCVSPAPGVYHLEFDEEVDGKPLRGKIDFQSVLPPARVGTGHLLYERGGHSNYFGWLVPAPAGFADVDCNILGRELQARTTDAVKVLAYHDHNWGDRPLDGKVHHWYWGRTGVQLGRDLYVAIAAHTVPTAAFGGVGHPDLVLVKNGYTLALGTRDLTFEQSTPLPDPLSGKLVSRLTRYRFVDDGATYVLTFQWLATAHYADLGSAHYHRFLGTSTLEVTAGGSTASATTPQATWELMWLGDNPPPEALGLYTRMSGLPDGPPRSSATGA